jgi:hypothetical protein
MKDPDIVLENKAGVRILESGRKFGHYHADGALCWCGYELYAAPMIFRANHKPGNPVMICSDHGVHAYRFLELVKGKQPAPSSEDSQ